MPVSKAAEREFKMGVAVMVYREKTSLKTGQHGLGPEERTNEPQQDLQARWWQGGTAASWTSLGVS